MGYYKLKATSDGQFMFNLHAANHEIILTSERYTAKASAEKGIRAVQTNSGDAGNYEKRFAKDGSPYFVLKAQNHEIIGTSEMYSSDSARDHGIASCVENGPGGEVKDEV